MMLNDIKLNLLSSSLSCKPSSFDSLWDSDSDEINSCNSFAAASWYVTNYNRIHKN